MSRPFRAVGRFFIFFIGLRSLRSLALGSVRLPLCGKQLNAARLHSRQWQCLYSGPAPEGEGANLKVLGERERGVELLESVDRGMVEGEEFGVFDVFAG